MPLQTLLFLVLAGVGAGLVGYLTGLASLVSYPAMLAAGLPPVAANVTQTLGLLWTGVGSTARALGVVRESSRRELTTLALLSTAGSLGGAGLLLLAGEGAFRVIVPWLVFVAAISVVASPWLISRRSGADLPVAHTVAVLLVSVYGGYFGAGAGTMFIALFLLTTSVGFGRAMVLKSVLVTVVNGVASLLFVWFAPVHWPAAIALALGCLLGGNLGPWVQGFVPEAGLRWGVGVSGLVLAGWLWAGR